MAPGMNQGMMPPDQRGYDPNRNFVNTKVAGSDSPYMGRQGYDFDQANFGEYSSSPQTAPVAASVAAASAAPVAAAVSQPTPTPAKTPEEPAPVKDDKIFDRIQYKNVDVKTDEAEKKEVKSVVKDSNGITKKEVIKDPESNKGCFVQIAYFNSERNAKNFIKKFNSDFPELKSKLVSDNSDGKYKLLIGPFESKQIVSWLPKIRNKGYSDAFKFCNI